MPAERRPLRGDRLEGGDGVDRPVHLGVVGVEQHYQPVKMMVGGEQGGLPDLPLLQFPVADHGEDPRVGAAEPVGEGEAQRRGQSLAERTAGVVHDGRALGADGLDRRAVLPVARHRLLVQQPQFGRGRERADDVVPRRADQPVHAGTGAGEHGRDLLGGRQRLAEITEPLRGDHPDGPEPDAQGQFARVGHGPAGSGGGDGHRLTHQTFFRPGGSVQRSSAASQRAGQCGSARQSAGKKNASESGGTGDWTSSQRAGSSRSFTNPCVPSTCAHSIPPSALGPRLREVREERGLAVRELARRLGCSASLISQVSGESVPHRPACSTPWPPNSTRRWITCSTRCQPGHRGRTRSGAPGGGAGRP